MTNYTAALLSVLIWSAWILQFVLRVSRQRGVIATKDIRARTGMLLEALSYFTVYTHTARFWNSPLSPLRIPIGLLFALVAFLLSWTAIKTLGRHWRVDAALNHDHTLVVSGPYRYVRHPIYASMLAMFLMSVSFAGSFPGALLAAILFFLGTEIRVRIEDRLLLHRFGQEFLDWRKRVPAYLPLIR